MSKLNVWESVVSGRSFGSHYFLLGYRPEIDGVGLAERFFHRYFLRILIILGRAVSIFQPKPKKCSKFFI